MISEYRRFLRDRGGKDELVAALEASGHALEASLLAQWSGGRLLTQARFGPYAGRRAWVGTTLPPEAREGDLWLDVVELMPMLLVPWSDLPRPLGWIALRPVERWQSGAGDEVAPVTGVSRKEAAAYAQRIGKSLATRTDWQVAAEGIDIAPLWGAARREWDDAVFDEVHSVFGRDTLDVDPHEAPDDPPGTAEDHRLFFYDTDTPADVGFRTFVRHDSGLLTGVGRDTEPVDPVPLTDAFTVFLRGGTGHDALVAALGDRLEASLLASWTGGVHRVGAGWVGPAVPAGAQRGDVWLDTAELMPMLLNDAGWLALRPVERWQYGAFLRVAKLRGKAKPASWFTPLDRTRLLAGPETAPISRLLREEAQLYADWFGKEIAGRAARRGEPLWGAVREWAEEAEPGIFSVIDAATVDLDPLAPEPPGRWDESRRRFEAWWAPFGVGFRTHIGSRVGAPVGVR